MDYPPAKARDKATLEAQIMDPGIAKNDAEWWAMQKIESLESDLRRLWHFAGCPFDHCEKCIADAEWIKGLHDRLGPPSAESVQAQHDAR